MKIKIKKDQGVYRGVVGIQVSLPPDGGLQSEHPELFQQSQKQEVPVFSTSKIHLLIDREGPSVVEYGSLDMMKESLQAVSKDYRRLGLSTDQLIVIALPSDISAEAVTAIIEDPRALSAQLKKRRFDLIFSAGRAPKKGRV